MPTSRVIIVGAGLAGAGTAKALRGRGYPGAITVLTAEDELPYERPPLSKGYLQGEQEFADAIVATREWYQEHDVDLRLGTRVTALDVSRSTVTLQDGAELEYDDLVLATGSEPIRPAIAGVDAAGVHVLRTRADADALRATFGEGRRLVCVGGGWIGLEAAAAARLAGCEVTVLERSSTPLVHLLGERVARVFADLHREHGVDLRIDVQVGGLIVTDGHVSGVRLADGTEIPADAVLLGTGAAPRVGLARAAGLAVDDGVLVDPSLRSSAPHVYAIGDIASEAHPVLGRRVRVQHWAAALNQPATVAAVICGEDAVHDDLPYFFTDQYDLGMEYIGSVGPHERVQLVVRGDLEGREFVAFWVSEDGAVRAAMNVNVWDVPDAVRPLIAECKPVDREALADPRVPYSHL